MSWRIGRAALLTLLAAACADSPAPLELRVEAGTGITRLWLVPAPGWKINALLPPAFEPVGAPPVRFTAARLTPDSAYFAEPPLAVLQGSEPPRGTLRASICAIGEQVCRPYVRVFGA
jgi:hypothetical protein